VLNFKKARSKTATHMSVILLFFRFWEQQFCTSVISCGNLGCSSGHVKT